MQHISKQISLSNIISRINSAVPCHTIMWESPVGVYNTYEEALDSIVGSQFDASTIVSKYAFKEFDSKLEPQGNYGMVPLPIDGNKMGGTSINKIIPFNQIIEWYGFLKKYYNNIGEDGTAEKHYLLETSKENVLQEELEKARELDKTVDDINNCFDGSSNRRAIEWIENNLFNDNAKEVVVSMDGDEPLKYGFISIPLSLTTDASDLGAMSIMEDDSLSVGFNTNLVYNFRVGNIYNSVDYIKDDNKIINTDEAIIITKIGDTELKINGCSGEESIRGYNTSLGVLNIADESTESGYVSVEVWYQKYHDFLCNNNLRYDGDKCDQIPYSSITTYYYNADNEVVYEEKGYKEYQATIFPLGFFSINSTDYPVEENYFVTYSGDSSSAYNGRRFPVFETTEHNAGDVKMLYCYVAEKKYIARIDNDGKYYFVFYNPTACNIDEKKCYVTDTKEKYIAIDGDYITVLHTENADKVLLIDEITEAKKFYKKMLGYCIIDSTTYYIDNVVRNKLYIKDGFKDIIEDEAIIGYDQNYIEAHPAFADTNEVEINADGLVKVFYSNKEMSSYYVTGYTDSRLNIVRDVQVSVDMMGNQLPGNFDFEYDVSAEAARTESNDKRVNSKFNEPYEGMTLELPYHIGNVNELEDTELGLMGDILNVIEIIGYDWQGTQIYGKTISMDTLYASGDIDAFLSFSLRDEINTCKESTTAVTMCKVSFTYDIGCNLITSVDKYPMYKLGRNGMRPITGVEYTEIYTVEEKQLKYYTDADNFIELRYYDLIPDLIGKGTDDEYGYRDITGPRAMFKMRANIYANGRWSNIEFGMSSSNGDMASPLIRKDELIGYSMAQNLSGNIYIDRGISTINEKQFRLMDARTVQALEKTGNYWFNIQEY